MKSLSYWLKIAQQSNWALPHFNISTADQLAAICEVAADLRSPIIIGVSEGEVDFIGYDVARELVTLWQKKTNLPLFLNADHHHSLERAKLAIDAGFDGVNIDLSLKEEMDNFSETRAVVEYARRQHRDISIEGEIGALKTQSSEINKKDIVVDDSSLTTIDQARRFVAQTGIDRLTPAVGNFHGMVAPGNHRKKLHFDRIKEIKEAVGLPLTLHGGSGLSDNDLKKAAELFSNIHINTELRLAYTEGIQQEIEKTTTPYKYLSVGKEKMKKVVEQKIKLFGSTGKA